MLVTKLGFSAFCKTLECFCWTNFCPYSFDTEQKKLIYPTSKRKLKSQIYSFHKWAMYAVNAFSAVRLVQAMGNKAFPLLLKILTFLWTFAYLLSSIGYYQFGTHRAEIMQFVNCLLKKMKLADDGGDKNTARGKLRRDNASSLSTKLIIALFAMASHAGVHVKLVEESPCAPHFSSSLFLPCKNYRSDEISFGSKLPFMAIEYYFNTSLFGNLSFNWSIIYLGLSWMILELREMKDTLGKDTILGYRRLECIANMMNYGFITYLSIFSNILLCLTGVLVFGIVKIWQIQPGSNLMFPLCAVRCGFEALTVLGAAGTIFDKNKEFLKKLKRRVHEQHCVNKVKMLRMWIRSCHGVKCTAGSMFTLENGIVVCCIHNTVQLTLNMLVTFQ